MGNVMMQARNLYKTYGQTHALRGISLDIREGEFLAIMGSSGSGKSTLLHALAGIELPDQGEVLYKGKDLTKWGDTKRTILRRSEFGFVFQFSQLVPELTALDNIAVPLLLSGQNKTVAYQKAREWIDVVGLSSHQSAFPGQMSGGEAQRVAIARALSVRPSILFADEPTGSLDTLNAESIMHLLLRLVKKEGMSIILVTHEASIAAYADREVNMRDGRLED